MRQDEYIRELQVLQEISDKYVGQLNRRRLMQICVGCDQSSGKSSALACITGIAFPVKSRIGIKAPIVVECRHDQTLELPVFEIQDRNSQLYRPVDLRTLASEIENIQNQLLNSDGISGHNVCQRQCQRARAHLDTFSKTSPSPILNRLISLEVLLGRSLRP